jgi:hypothetical protein
MQGRNPPITMNRAKLYHSCSKGKNSAHNPLISMADNILGNIFSRDYIHFCSRLILATARDVSFWDEMTGKNKDTNKTRR